MCFADNVRKCANNNSKFSFSYKILFLMLIFPTWKIYFSSLFNPRIQSIINYQKLHKQFGATCKCKYSSVQTTYKFSNVSPKHRFICFCYCSNDYYYHCDCYYYYYNYYNFIPETRRKYPRSILLNAKES